jgi:hypothetical protein
MSVQMRERHRQWIAVIGAVVLGGLLGLGLRLTVFLAAATCLGSAGQLSNLVLTQRPLLDPIYTQAAIGSLVSLHVQGVAIAGPLGDWLHQRWPDVFVANWRSHGAVARLAVQPGSAVLARLLAAGTASQLSPEARAAQLDSDMAALTAMGVNTVLGWDPAEFDGTLLDAAQRHGIGVILPFDLDPDADYTDPLVRQQLSAEVTDWVLRYRAHPAVRMWGIGNEVLHKIVHPAWVGPQDPHQELEAEAFSDWLIQTADVIHALDPDHPVTYRDAEDAFAGWVVGAVQRNGNTPRPWFAYGTNCYQPYLGDIVDRWPSSGLASALWVSEFAPGGMAVPDRPDGFATMWGYVTRHPEWVLGGAVYAWTRNGPEGVDRNFGLTDDGVPVDGRSLDTLDTLFHE